MRKTAHRNRTLHYFIPAVLVALALLACFPCLPAIAAPVLTLVPSSGPIGVTVSIHGSVFDSYKGDIIHIFFDAAEIEGSPIVIPEDGIFTMTTVIPPTAAPGQHTFGAKRNTADVSFFTSSTFTVEQPQISLDVKEGNTGSDVVLSGSGFYAGAAVVLRYYNPTALNIGTVSASAAGKFSQTYKIPAGVAGNHRFNALNVYGNIAETTFKVLPSITLSLDTASPGVMLTVKGSGFGDSRPVSITFGPLVIAAPNTDNLGNFEAAFFIPDITPQTYQVKATDSLKNTAEAPFTIAASAALSANFGSIGSPVTVRGAGFLPVTKITVYYDDVPVITGISDNNGGFILTFNIPPSAGGGHIITVSDEETTRQYPYTVETAPPPAPAVLLPEHNGITGANTYFQWQGVTDTSLPVIYELEISSDRNFSNIILGKTGLNEAQYTLTQEETLAADATNSLFFWRVRATDGAANQGDWSGTRSFYVDIPRVPALLLPGNDAVMDFPVRFSWESVTALAAPVTYSFQISRNIEFTELLIAEKSLAAADYVVTEESKQIFNKDIPYYWRVRAADSAQNTGGWSAVGSFRIARSGFPVWATVILVCLAVVILVLLAFRFGRRTAYQQQ